MDIRCPHCAEPWDLDSLHDAVDEGLHEDFAAARKAFTVHGCKAFDTSHGELIDAGRRNLISEVYALSGDDIDGAASDLEDAEFLGLI